MFLAGILISLIISASARDVGRKASDGDLGAATLASGGYVLLVGGQYESMETWTPTAANGTNGPQYNPLPPSDLWGSKAALLESSLFSCGGDGDMAGCFTTQEGQPDWEPAPSLQVGRKYHSLTAVDGSLVAAGGWNGSDYLSSVEILGETGWSTASWSLKAPVYDHCAVSFQGELVIIGGSYGSTTNSTYDEVTSYNIRTGESTSLPKLPYGVWEHACTIVNDTITISGGATHNGYTHQVWQLINNTWVELPSLKNWRRAHAMGVLGGQLFVLGSGGTPLRTVVRLTPDGWEDMEKELQEFFSDGGAIFIE